MSGSTYECTAWFMTLRSGHQNSDLLAASCFVKTWLGPCQRICSLPSADADASRLLSKGNSRE